jgi:hypothetical protein
MPVDRMSRWPRAEWRSHSPPRGAQGSWVPTRLLDRPPTVSRSSTARHRGVGTRRSGESEWGRRRLRRHPFGFPFSAVRLPRRARDAHVPERARRPRSQAKRAQCVVEVVRDGPLARHTGREAVGTPQARMPADRISR